MKVAATILHGIHVCYLPRGTDNGPITGDDCMKRFCCTACGTAKGLRRSFDAGVKLKQRGLRSAGQRHDGIFVWQHFIGRMAV